MAEIDDETVLVRKVRAVLEHAKPVNSTRPSSSIGGNIDIDRALFGIGMMVVACFFAIAALLPWKVDTFYRVLYFCSGFLCLAIGAYNLDRARKRQAPPTASGAPRRAANTVVPLNRDKSR